MKNYTNCYLVLLFFCSFFLSKTTFAAGGPDSYGYIWKDSNDPGGPAYNWIDIKNFQEVIDVKLLSDDNFRGPYPLGFNFPYYWYGFDEFSIGSNGNLSLEHQQYAQPYFPFPSNAVPQNIIAPFGTDLSFEFDSTAKCYLYIAADLDSVVVTWEDVPFFDTIPPLYSTPFRNTFQVILCTTDSSITFQYKEVHAYQIPANYYFSAGIESNAGDIGLSYRYGVFPSNQTAVKFYRPYNPTFQLTDVGVNWSGAPGTKGITVNNNSTLNAFESSLINLGNSPVDSVNLTGTLFDPAGNVILTINQITGQILPGQTQSVQFPGNYTFTQIGRYSFRTNFYYPGDSLTHNNQKKQEIIVIDTLQGPVTLGWSDYWADSPFNWVSFTGGLGTYITPPFYPFQITTLMYYVSTRATGASFYAHVFSDSFIPGQPGIPLFSTLVNSNSFGNHDWCEIQLNPPIHLNSGSIYVAWEGDGSNVTFGVDYDEPYSNHAFEFAGLIWALFRFHNVEPMIAVKAIPAHTFDGIKEPEEQASLSIFPNPSTGLFHLFSPRLVNGDGQVPVEIFNVQGQKVWAENRTCLDGKMSLDLRSLDDGIYWVRIPQEEEMVQGKLIVNH